MEHSSFQGRRVGSHYTQTKACRNLSLKAVARLDEEECYETLKQIRWAANSGEPICPHCGSLKACFIKTRVVYKCAYCRKQFSLTSGTIFARRKMPYADILLACAQFSMNPSGRASIRMADEVGVHHTTAFVMVHKLREAMASEMLGITLEGEVEIDGCYLGNYVRPRNYKTNRIDRRKFPSPNKKVMGVARQRGGPAIVQVNKFEKDFKKFVNDRVDHNAVVYADEAPGWDSLVETFQMKRVIHEECYSDQYACTNQAESFFSRVRRGENGVYHHISSDQYADLYAEEFAWRENNRRISHAERYLKLLALTMRAPISRRMSGYWQRGRR